MNLYKPIEKKRSYATLHGKFTTSCISKTILHKDARKVLVAVSIATQTFISSIESVDVETQTQPILAPIVPLPVIVDHTPAEVKQQLTLISRKSKSFKLK